MDWYVLKVLPGHEARIRVVLEERLREVPEVVRVLLPLQSSSSWGFGIRGRVKPRWRKTRPGYLFLQIRGAEIPPKALELLGMTRGVGAVHGRAGVPVPLSQELGSSLSAGTWPPLHARARSGRRSFTRSGRSHGHH